MEFVRIGEKLIDKGRLLNTVERILDLRSNGLSQQETADRVGIDRTFVSRLESLGEIRKGGRVALVGFPVGNKNDIYNVAREEGVDFVLLMDDEERWRFVRERSGLEVLNEIMAIISKLRIYDVVIFIGSDMRCNLVESILGNRVISIVIGASPIKKDAEIDPETIRKIIREIVAS
ncbi:MAG: helix-turn-helix transcriptional regulator [Firmicutes bacterium]|nr:helix-turn-helix transcriptional regulator [Bacillota bacterium]